MTFRPIHAALIALSAITAGCTTADPTVYAGLASAPQLQPNPEDKSGRVPYRYTSNVDWRQYDKIIIDPVTIYSGPDNQFVKMAEKDKAVLANYMQDRFAEKLRPRFASVNSASPGTLRLHLTLTGAKDTTPFLGPFSHLDVGGNVINAAQAVRGREGTMAGSVNYAVEIYDAPSNRLLSAYVTKQYPNAMNAGATFSPLKGSKVGIDKGADALLAQFK
ncbi:hypothetical protein ADU59_25280 [Pararhizobium polonicum]|uniref:Lipoprotein n=1 Tax=Pararhizobium polonicum TaxID=1612624 RepID=A0A1C7NUP0_9HYPH|nr:DUF3313 domain-containing protein [Pararhizobium polonicum]OBZ92699.1 hypothetical protein ADU59_25280 [Pararhizobium polonicum]